MRQKKIVATAVFACAAAAPSGTLLATHGILTYGAYPVASLSVAPINSGDLQAAAINAHVEASDQSRAVVDAVQEVNDQAAENHGRAINAAEDHAWQAVNSAQVAAAEIDGAAASVSPAAARSVVAPVSPVLSYSVPSWSYAAPSILSYSAPSFISPALSYSSPLAGGSQSISYQSLHQTHPSPVVAYAHNYIYA
ncbi:unnamed protein product, partial [Brenthis ino]